MNVPFGDLKTHYALYRNELSQAANRVLESGHYLMGPELEAFEKAFAEYLGTRYVVGCASGTEAIYLMLAALNIGPGDEVITVAHTAVPTISAISMTGATPVFVDIDSSTYLMDSSKLEAKITAKTKAIVPVHLYGQMADMDEILAIGQKHRIPVLEDCAQSSGATYKNAKAGSLGFMGAFSFYPSKNLGAFGDGGAVSTNCAQTYEKLKRLRYYGQSARRYYHDEIGINSRLDDIQAAILRTQLPHLDRWNARRNEIAQAYNKGLKGLVLTPFAADNRNHVYHLYVIRVENRDQLQEQLLTRGVQTLIHYPIPAHLQKAYAFLGYKEGSLPVTENIAQRILSLPIYPHLTDAQVQTVIDAVREFCSTSPTPTVVTTPWLTQPALS